MRAHGYCNSDDDDNQKGAKVGGHALFPSANHRLVTSTTRNESNTFDYRQHKKPQYNQRTTTYAHYTHTHTRGPPHQSQPTEPRHVDLPIQQGRQPVHRDHPRPRRRCRRKGQLGTPWNAYGYVETRQGHGVTDPSALALATRSTQHIAETNAPALTAGNLNLAHQVWLPSAKFFFPGESHLEHPRPRFTHQIAHTSPHTTLYFNRLRIPRPPSQNIHVACHTFRAPQFLQDLR